jgi:uncharacterized membrane protein YgcG
MEILIGLAIAVSLVALFSWVWRKNEEEKAILRNPTENYRPPVRVYMPPPVLPATTTVSKRSTTSSPTPFGRVSVNRYNENEDVEFDSTPMVVESVLNTLVNSTNSYESNSDLSFDPEPVFKEYSGEKDYSSSSDSSDNSSSSWDTSSSDSSSSDWSSSDSSSSDSSSDWGSSDSSSSDWSSSDSGGDFGGGGSSSDW